MWEIEHLPDGTLNVGEFGMLTSCALRFDGYAWCEDQKLKWGRVLEASTRNLFKKPIERQMTVLFLQQRLYRYQDVIPTGENLALWRRLFIAVADKDVPEEFRALDFYAEWEECYKPMTAALIAAVAERMAQGDGLDKPMIIRPPETGRRAV